MPRCYYCSRTKYVSYLFSPLFRFSSGFNAFTADIPCIVGCGNATHEIETGDAVTIDCSRGDVGMVLEGIYEFEKNERDLGELTRTKTKIMMNLANPDRALELSFIPNSGVGLGRLEFIISNSIYSLPCFGNYV